MKRSAKAADAALANQHERVGVLTWPAPDSKTRHLSSAAASSSSTTLVALSAPQPPSRPASSPSPSPRAQSSTTATMMTAAPSSPLSAAKQPSSPCYANRTPSPKPLSPLLQPSTHAPTSSKAARLTRAAASTRSHRRWDLVASSALSPSSQSSYISPVAAYTSAQSCTSADGASCPITPCGPA